MIDYHVHLERGSYTLEWLKSFIDIGNSVGISEFGIVEHLYMFKEASHLLHLNEHIKAKQNRNINDYIGFINNMKDLGLPVKLGFEVDYTKENEIAIQNFCKSLNVDFLIGSVHYLEQWGFDLNPDWRNRSIKDTYIKYFKELLCAAASKSFDILGHVGNIAYHGHHLTDKEEYQLFTGFFEQVSKEDIVLEINAGGLYRPAGIVFPQLKYLDCIRELGIEITVSSDAHNPKYTGWKINELLIPSLKEAGFSYIVGYKNREKQYFEL